MVKKHTYVYYRSLQIYHTYSMRAKSSKDKMKIASYGSPERLTGMRAGEMAAFLIEKDM